MHTRPVYVIHPNLPRVELHRSESLDSRLPNALTTHRFNHDGQQFILSVEPVRDVLLWELHRITDQRTEKLCYNWLVGYSIESLLIDIRNRASYRDFDEILKVAFNNINPVKSTLQWIQ